MIQRISHVTVYVLDQERAARFYTDTLGFEVRADSAIDGFRWLTVSPREQPQFEILLAEPQPPMFAPADAAVMRTLIAKGALGGAVLETNDCLQTYTRLAARGVTFISGPTERPYGIEAILRDDSGNWFSLLERR